MGAGLLTFAAVGAVAAIAPTYTISATKTADPPSVPADGGDVTFTVSVTNTGTGHFNGPDVVVSDDLVGCTLTGTHPTGPSDKLEAGDTWTWTCTVADVAPDTTNTAHIDVCHNGGACGNAGAQATSASPSVTVTLCESDCGGGNETGQPPTDTDFASTGTSGPADVAWLLIGALGALLGSLVILRPSGGKRPR